MYHDLIHGKMKWQIKKKFMDGGYNNKTVLERSFHSYWKDMLERFGDEYEKYKEEIREKFIAKYMYLYEEAVKNNNMKVAKDILDSLSKLFGLYEPEKQEINLNGEIIVDFGFDA